MNHDMNMDMYTTRLTRWDNPTDREKYNLLYQIEIKNTNMPIFLVVTDFFLYYILLLRGKRAKVEATTFEEWNSRSNYETILNFIFLPHQFTSRRNLTQRRVQHPVPAPLPIMAMGSGRWSQAFGSGRC